MDAIAEQEFVYFDALLRGRRDHQATTWHGQNRRQGFGPALLTGPPRALRLPTHFAMKPAQWTEHDASI
jgi:hypothetical protein